MDSMYTLIIWCKSFSNYSATIDLLMGNCTKALNISDGWGWRSMFYFLMFLKALTCECCEFIINIREQRTLLNKYSLTDAFFIVLYVKQFNCIDFYHYKMESKHIEQFRETTKSIDVAREMPKERYRIWLKIRQTLLILNIYIWRNILSVLLKLRRY